MINIISLQKHKNIKKEPAQMSDEDAESILSEWFELDFKITNENGLYKAKINDDYGIQSIETWAADIWMSIYDGRTFSQLSDIICSYLTLLAEQRDLINECFVYVNDSENPNEMLPCTVIDEHGVIADEVTVKIKTYGDASELEFYYKDGHRMHGVTKWYQDKESIMQSHNDSLN